MGRPSILVGTALGDHHGAGELVGEGLPTGVPQWPQQADWQAGHVEHVGEVADEGVAGADRQAVVHAEQADAQDSLAPRLAGASLQQPAVVDVQQQRAEPKQVVDQQRAAAVTGHDVGGADVAGGEEDHRRQRWRDNQQGVEHPGAEPLWPARERPAHELAGLIDAAAVARVHHGPPSRPWSWPLACCSAKSPIAGSLRWRPWNPATMSASSTTIKASCAKKHSTAIAQKSLLRAISSATRTPHSRIPCSALKRTSGRRSVRTSARPTPNGTTASTIRVEKVTWVEITMVTSASR